MIEDEDLIRMPIHKLNRLGKMFLKNQDVVSEIESLQCGYAAIEVGAQHSGMYYRIHSFDDGWQYTMNFTTNGELVRAILGQAVQPAVTSDKVRPRLIESQGGGLLIVFNDQITDQSVKIQVPSRYKTAMNIYGNQPQNIQGGAVDIQVPFEGVSVLLLS